MMNLRCRCAFVACLLFTLPAALGSQRPAGAVLQEREQAAREVPQLAELAALKPGMIVADVGAGGVVECRGAGRRRGFHQSSERML